MKKLFFAAAAAAMLCGAPLASQAADQDVAKVSCKEFLDSKENMPMMIMWIDGYMSAQSDNTVLSEEWIQKLGTHLGSFCAQNPSKTIMDAIEAMPAE